MDKNPSEYLVPKQNQDGLNTFNSNLEPLNQYQSDSNNQNIQSRGNNTYHQDFSQNNYPKVENSSQNHSGVF